MGLLSSSNKSTTTANWFDQSTNIGGDQFVNTGSMQEGIFNEGSGAISLGGGMTFGAGGTLNYDASADLAGEAISAAQASAILAKEVAMKQIDSANEYVRTNANLAEQSIEKSLALAGAREDAKNTIPIAAIAAVVAIVIAIFAFTRGKS